MDAGNDKVAGMGTIDVEISTKHYRVVSQSEKWILMN
jgi:hypothetical protein